MVSSSVSDIKQEVQEQLAANYGRKATLENQISGLSDISDFYFDEAKIFEIYEQLMDKGNQHPVVRKALLDAVKYITPGYFSSNFDHSARETVDRLASRIPKEMLKSDYDFDTYVYGFNNTIIEAGQGFEAKQSELEEKFGTAAALLKERLEAEHNTSEGLTQGQIVSVLGPLVKERAGKPGVKLMREMLGYATTAVEAQQQVGAAASADALLHEYNVALNSALEIEGFRSTATSLHYLNIELDELDKKISYDEEWLERRHVSSAKKAADMERKFTEAHSAIRGNYHNLKQLALLGDSESLEKAVGDMEHAAAYLQEQLAPNSTKIVDNIKGVVSNAYKTFNEHGHGPLYGRITEGDEANQAETAKTNRNIRRGWLYTGVSIVAVGAIAITALVTGGGRGPEGPAGPQGPAGEVHEHEQYVTDDELEERLQGLVIDPTATATPTYAPQPTATPQPTTVPTGTPESTPTPPYTPTPPPTATAPPTATPQATATATAQPTPAGIRLADLMNANAFCIGYNLARDMYRSNPEGFNAAFGVVPGAQPQVGNWFDGNPANAEATTVDGAVMRVNQTTTKVHLLENGRGAEFASDLNLAREFMVEYLTENTDRLAEIVLE